MAKLPAEIAKERAQKALARQKKDEQRRAKKELKSIQEYEEKEANLAEIAEKEAKRRNAFADKAEEARQKKMYGYEVVNKEELKKAKVTLEEGEGDGIYNDDSISLNITEDELKEKKTTGWINILNKRKFDIIKEQNKTLKKYFFENGAVPKWKRYPCSCCGKLKAISEYHKSWSVKDSARMDDEFFFHKSFCKDCARQIFVYHYLETSDRNEILAMEHYCADTDTYWDLELYRVARKMFEENPTAISVVNEYHGAVGRLYQFGLCFWDSPTIKNRDFAQQDTVKNFATEVANSFSIPMEWEKEEILIRKRILKLLRYDPFENENDEDKRVMYRNLELMIDDSMSEDFVKLQAAIEIVRGFQRIQRLRVLQQKMEDENADFKEIASISKLRKEEQDQVTKFSNDHGFTARFAQKKAKGAGTLTGCMSDMKEAYYEDGLLNYYDIKTCKEMQEVANMSFEAIFRQISLTDSDTYKMIQTQTERIRKLEDENMKLKETIRKKNYETKKRELVAEARKNGNYDAEEEPIEVKETPKEKPSKEKKNKKQKEEEDFLKAFLGDDV